MLHRALLDPDPVTHFFTKQSSIVSSLNNSRPSLLVYLEQVHLYIGKVLLWSAKNHVHNIHVANY